MKLIARFLLRWRRLRWRLLALQLVQLLLALLHLLHDLLGRAREAAGTKAWLDGLGNRLLLRQLFRFSFRGVVVAWACDALVGGTFGASSIAGAEHNLPWSSFAEVANHQNVIA
jgi:hypothetical protein